MYQVKNRQRLLLASYGLSILAALILYVIYIVLLSGLPIPLVDVTDPFFFCRSFPVGRIPLFIMAMLFALERMRTPSHAISIISNSPNDTSLGDIADDHSSTTSGQTDSEKYRNCLQWCSSFEFLTYIVNKFSPRSISNKIAVGLSICLVVSIILSSTTTVVVWFLLRFLMEFLSPIVFGVWMFLLTPSPHSSDIQESFLMSKVLKSQLLLSVSNWSLAIYTLHYPIAQYFFIFHDGIKAIQDGNYLWIVKFVIFCRTLSVAFLDNNYMFICIYANYFIQFNK